MTNTASTAVGNWGRWGPDDEGGTLNLLTPEVIAAAAAGIRSGTVYALGLPIQADGVPLIPFRGAPRRVTLVNQADPDMFADLGAVDVGANEDLLIIASHNGTHMDALCHVHHQGMLYNGFAADTMRTHTGASRCGIDKQPWIVGRAVLVDIAGHHGVDCLEVPHIITADEIKAVTESQDVELRSGDILLVRTGWLGRYLRDPSVQQQGGQPGIGIDACRLIAETGIAAVGADNSAIEAMPFDGDFLAVHIELLVRQGVPLLEHLVLDQMAAGRAYESLLVVAPLPVAGACGSPVNPIAIT
jgi:kynurenine formamidase